MTTDTQAWPQWSWPNIEKADEAREANKRLRSQSSAPPEIRSTDWLDAAVAADNALSVARETLHIWHGDVAWPDYQHSPEMKTINKAQANLREKIKAANDSSYATSHPSQNSTGGTPKMSAPMPPCDHDECPPTRCLKTVAAPALSPGETLESASGSLPEDDVVRTIKSRAKEYCLDNIQWPTPRDFLYTENAMLIGASIVEEKAANEKVSDCGQKV